MLRLCITNVWTFQQSHPGHLRALQKTSGLTDISCCYESYFLDFGTKSARRCQILGQHLSNCLKISVINYSSGCCIVPLFIQATIKDSTSLCHFTLTSRRPLADSPMDACIKKGAKQHLKTKRTSDVFQTVLTDVSL